MQITYATNKKLLASTNLIFSEVFVRLQQSMQHPFRFRPRHGSSRTIYTRLIN